MKRRVWRNGLALVTAAVVAAYGGGTVAAQETAAAPIEYVLTGASAASSTLAGSEAGSFAYYRIGYPGEDTDLRIRVTIGPSVGDAAGFHVYGPNGRVDKGSYVGNEGQLEVTYQEPEAADLLVQVFNYGTTTISYVIEADGLPEAEEPAAAEAADQGTAAERTAASAEDSGWQGASGTVLGSRGGAYAVHALQYAGDGEEITVMVGLWPADASLAEAFGLNVYGPTGDLVATARSTDTPGVREATWASEEAGSFYLQVFNYSDDVVLTYTLAVAR